MDEARSAEEEQGKTSSTALNEAAPKAGSLKLDSNGDGVESASTGGSSEGKSASGGGYSADCSASDQSSDDAGGRKEGSSDVKLSVASLNLNDNNGNRNDAGGRASSLLDDDDDYDGDDNDAASEGKREKVKKGKKDNRKVDHRSGKVAAGDASSTEQSAVDDNSDSSDSKYRNHAHRKSRHGGGVDIHALLEGQKNGGNEENIEAAYSADKGPLPQWGGIRIKHPMDPRIDLSTVGCYPADTNINPVTAGPVNGESPKNMNQFPSMESYLQLLEVVRPFFHAQGIPYGAAPAASAQRAGSASDGTNGAPSSEGFTSFFTTTHSSANNSGSPNSSDLDKKPPAAAPPPQQPPLSPAAVEPQDHAGDPKEEDEPSDGASSMAVLARVKRKYRRPGDEDEGEEGGESNSSRERRVRIQEAHAEANHRPQDARRDDEENGGNQESSMSSGTSSDNINANGADAGDFRLPSRIVTDVSSSARGDSTASNGNSGSGSGSGGNTGSGSNQGSSGSGNDGKGSSEDVAKEDNSGENDGSDGIGSENSAKHGLGLNKVAHRQEQVHPEQAPKNPALDENNRPESEDVAREKKLQDKKRKRIEMRREYEALQQSESSENTDGKGDQILRPGRPVTLERVLFFSKIPRIVVQATPPFLIVHTNAAFSRLTGLESHHVVGNPISSLLSLPEKSVEGTEAHDPSSADSGRAQAVGEFSVPPVAARGFQLSQQSVNKQNHGLERLVASSGFGHLHIVQVRSKANSMLGKKVTIVQGSPSRLAALASHARDEGSSSTGRAGAYEGYITCRSSIAPVVSSPAPMDSAVVSDTGKECSLHAKGKRRKLSAADDDAHRKHANNSADHVKHFQQQMVTHYAIQLHQLEAGLKHESAESLSSHSTSVEARLLGLSKAELHGLRMVMRQSENREEHLADRKSVV